MTIEHLLQDCYSIPDNYTISRMLLDLDRPIRVKMGFDPTKPDVHLGHMVGLRKLRKIQDMEDDNKVIIVIGDWTAQIGDPTGWNETRPMISRWDVESNSRSFTRQIFKILDEKKTQVVAQSEWYDDFNLADLINLTNRFTLSQLMDRKDFASRFHSHLPITLTEFLYPLMQAYDSVMIHSDIEVSGVDQTFNVTLGRDMQQSMGQEPQACLFVPILPGTDGKNKMSKGLDNSILVIDSADDIFNKIISIPDFVVPIYYDLLTDMNYNELKMKGSPSIDEKQLLAFNIVSQLYDVDVAGEIFKVFAKEETPTNNKYY